MLPDSQHFGGQRGVLELWDETKKNDKQSIIHMDLHKPNNKLVSAQLEHFWCQDEPGAKLDSQNSPWLGLGGNHHLPLYSILYAQSQHQHPNDIFSWDSQNDFLFSHTRKCLGLDVVILINLVQILCKKSIKITIFYLLFLFLKIKKIAEL